MDGKPLRRRRGGRRCPAWVAATFLAAPSISCSGIEMRDLVSPRPVPAESCVVVGFLGGRGAWDDASREVRKTALRLRGTPGLFVETFENRRRDVAARFVLEALDADGSGAFEPGEGAHARLVLYGLSFGGAAVVKLARDLEGHRVPVALTIQVDSVGRGDGTVPPNVAQALNLYQDDGWIIAGEHPVRAEDPERTAILANLRFDYGEPPGSEVDINHVPWWSLIFRVAHARMSHDPAVWSLVERVLRAACNGEDLKPLVDDAGRR